MLRICIAGFTECGKTTLGNMLAEKLNIMHITKRNLAAFKDYEKSPDKSEEMKILQTAAKKYAHVFDNEVMELAEKNDCVVTTWVGAWIVKDPTLRVWLSTPFMERVSRNTKKGHSKEDAEAYIKKKDEMNTKGFKDLYGIDLNDHSGFDMEINTARLTNEQAVSLIAMLSIEKEGKNFR